MLQTSPVNPIDPTPSLHYSDDELRRMRADTLTLLTAGMKEAAARVVASVQPPAPGESRALLERIKQDLARAQAAFAARTPQDAREDSRFACDALKLFRACARARCRKAQACRGDPVGCYAHARVPEPVREWAARLLLAEHVPWLPLFADASDQRLAYACWIAGIEARR